MKTETKCLHAGYEPKNGEPREVPIYQSTTFKYDSSLQMGRLFDLEDSGYFYSRLQNPTNDIVASKIAAEGAGSEVASVAVCLRAALSIATRGGPLQKIRRKGRRPADQHPGGRRVPETGRRSSSKRPTDVS